MKKIYYYAAFLAAATGLTLTSCSDAMEGDSVSMDNTIQVRAMMGNQIGSRSVPDVAETTTAALKGFSLFAWQTDVSNPIIDANYTGSNGTFNDATPEATPHYWPEGTVNFWAYALNNNAPGTTTRVPELNEGNTGLEFSWDVHVDDASIQNDPVLAFNAQPKNEDDNIVSLTFQHLLSRVGVNVYAPKYNQNTVRLLGFGFTNVSVKGDFAFPFANKTDEPLAASTWTQFAEGGQGNVGLAEVVLPAEGVENPTVLWWTAGANEGPTMPCKETDEEDLQNTFSTKLADTPWLNVIPGNNVADQLVLTYEVQNPEKDTWTTHVATVELSGKTIKNDTSITTDDNIYRPGYEYIYNVRILGQNSDDATVEQAAIEVDDITVNPWNSEAVEEVKTENQGSGSNLKKILDDAPAFSTVTLTQDVILDDVRIDLTKDVNIDLGGHTLTVTHAGGNGSAFNIVSGRASITNGTIVCTQSDSNGYTGEVDAITVRSGAELTIDGVEITVNSATGACLYAFDGSKIYVKGGTYKNLSENNAENGFKQMCLNQKDVNTQLIFVSGGTFYGQDPAKGDNAHYNAVNPTTVSTFLQEGYKSVYDEETNSYTVSKIEEEQAD